MIHNGWRWLAARPFLMSVLLVVAVVVPVVARLQYAIDEAHDSADAAQEGTDDLKDVVARLDAVVAAREADRMERRKELCERDVADQEQERAMWEAAFILFEGAPEVAQLRLDLEALHPHLECDAEFIAVPIGES